MYLFSLGTLQYIHLMKQCLGTLETLLGIRWMLVIWPTLRWTIIQPMRRSITRRSWLSGRIISTIYFTLNHVSSTSCAVMCLCSDRTSIVDMCYNSTEVKWVYRQSYRDLYVSQLTIKTLQCCTVVILDCLLFRYYHTTYCYYHNTYWYYHNTFCYYTSMRERPNSGFTGD